MAAVCMVCETSMSAEPRGSRGGQYMESRLATEAFILPTLGRRRRECVREDVREGVREGGCEGGSERGGEGEGGKCLPCSCNPQ